MNIVITGINGFVGKHLTNELLNNGHIVLGVGQEEAAHNDIGDRIHEYASCNLTIDWPTFQAPVDAVIHLAGLAAVGPSFDRPQDYINLNSAMVSNMCQSYINEEKKPRIVLVSSGAIYNPKQEMPISENGEIGFNSPYAVSKILTENQAAYYNTRGLECIVVRPFNHIGPGQLPGFLVPDLAQKILDRTDQSEPIMVGDLSTRRDYTDVRDVVRAYRLIATTTPAEPATLYNVCSGESVDGKTILGYIVQALAIDEPEVVVDTSLIRPNDAKDIKGDNTRLGTNYGWKPEYSLQQTISDFITESKTA